MFSFAHHAGCIVRWSTRRRFTRVLFQPFTKDEWCETESIDTQCKQIFCMQKSLSLVEKHFKLIFRFLLIQSNSGSYTCEVTSTYYNDNSLDDYTDFQKTSVAAVVKVLCKSLFFFINSFLFQLFFDLRWGVGKTNSVLVSVKFSAHCCVCHFLDI